MVTFKQSHLEDIANQIDILRSMETDIDSPIYCLLTHAMEDVLLITELYQI